MAAGVQGAGTALSVVGAIQQGQSEKYAADYNASLAEDEANQTLVKAAEDERRLRIAQRKQLGDMRASYGASGVQLEGSALDVVQESAASAELDALTVRHQGTARATQLRNEARMSRYQGETATSRALLTGLGAGMSGAGSILRRT